MKIENPIVRGTLCRAALLTVIATAHAAEQVVDAGAANINVTAGDSVWFDSANTNAPIPLGTINSVTPATGFLPGWAHTRWSFLKYDGANVLEIPNAEKSLGNANLATATAASTYYDNGAASALNASQSIGLLETTRDFVIANGATLDIALGGLMYHGANHWVKNGTGGGFVTSSSGQLTLISNGGLTDGQINGLVVKDFDGTTPLTLVKTGPDHLNLSGVANTYTGGTWINNGRLRASNVASYGAASGIVHVAGANSQACLAAAGTFGNSFEIEGLGWTETPGKTGAIRFEAASTINGSVTLADASRMTVNAGVSGAITGALSGSTALEIGFPATTLTGTLNLNGSGTGMTGPVTVSAGRLNVNNGLGGSVIVADGATLGGESSIAGDLTIGGATASGLVADGATPAVLAVAGAVDISGGTTTVTVAGVPAPAAPFTAFTYGSLTGPTTNLAVTGVRGGTLTDDTVNKQIVVNFTPGTLNWTGTTNANWTQNADLNFDDGAATNFFHGDQVTFGEAAPVKSVTLVGMLYPGSVTFDHTSDYTVLGPNAGIGGATGLTKNGSGTLTLNGQVSSFTGPVAVNAGRIKYGTHWEALGYNSGVTIAAGAQVDLNGAYLANVGRTYDWTVAGSGPDGLGAITNSGAGTPGEAAGLRTLTLTADAAIGGNGGRLDVGNGAGTGILTGNGHTLTKVGSNAMGFRANASAAPVNFVIAEGYAWAENTDDAWGGATGTLRIKNGTRAGTYGTRTIATPVFLETGSKLHNQGGGKGTWTATVTLEGDATVESDLGLIDLMGPVTGAFALTKTGTQTAYLAGPQYTGDTTVSAGTLSLGTPTLGDTTTVSIATTAGTKLDLPHGQSDSVSVLLIDGVPQPVGTYGSVASGADHPDDNHFSGNGMLNVTSSGSAYQSWAATHGISGALGAVDSDNDGIPNGIEFVLGSDPSDSDSSSLAPTLDNSNPAYVEFSFRRTDDSAGDNPYVQYGSDLTGWTVAEPGEPVANPVVINETFDAFGAGIDRVTVRIPRALAEGSALFARLRVDIP